MKHRLKNEHGLSLVELLAVFVILGILSTIAYTVIFSGYKAYDRINVESDLRDEADIIMAELISDLYTLKESEIANTPTSSQPFFELKNGKKIGFDGGKVLLKAKTTNSLHSGKIKLHDDSKIMEEDEGLFHIYLTLEWDNGDRIQTLTTESVVSILKDQ